MRHIFFSFILILIICNVSNGQIKVSDIVGSYENCSGTCEWIRLNSDMTFDIVIQNHIGSNKETVGNWMFITNNKIQLSIAKRNLIKGAKELKGKAKGDISLTLTDGSENVYPGISISYIHQGEVYKDNTDVNGHVDIKRTDQIEIEFNGYKETYNLKNKATSGLEIYIDLLAEDATINDFELRKKKICFVPDNRINNVCHKKISEKKAKNIFLDKYK